MIPTEDLTDIQAIIEGPAGTPFEGVFFKVKLKLDHDFPNAPPKGFFLTKIFHPNISNKGEICVNTLKKDWKPDLGIKHILLTIKCLLIVPNPESALNEEAGKLLLEKYEDYFKHAKLMTSIHATNKNLTNTNLTDNEKISSLSIVQSQSISIKKNIEKKKSLKRL
jgi:ubiquitin-conjugating enzyme E2 S